MMTTTDLGEMVATAAHANDSGFKAVSVDVDHVLEIGEMVGKLVELTKSLQEEFGCKSVVYGEIQDLLKELGE